ncbi:MAG TPA: ATP-binding protein [Pyrinomonadaceae bacterium]|nr:ATP-binding protein [Pyrinomonadaceae bacterium]
MSEADEELRAAKSTRRRGAPWLFGGLVLLLLSVLVTLQVFGLWEVFTPDTASDTLLIYALSTLNFVAFFLFSFILIRSLLKLRRERRERQLGSKIKTRLVVYFIAVSLLPITATALFSNMFFNRTLEKYFSNFPEGVVREANDAQQRDYQQQSEQLVDLAALAAVQLNRQPGEITFEQLSELADGRFAALAVFDRDGGVVAEVVHAQYADLRPQLEGLVRGTSGAGAATFGRKTFDVTVAPLAGGRKLLAVREQQQDANLSTLAVGAQRFEGFKRGQRRVRLLGLSTIGLLTLMLLFAATWSAIHLARGIGTPIRALAEAARAVAGGNLAHRVEPVTDDELAVLADAFNDMTAQLSENRRRLEANAAELREKNCALEERRHYIETVLQTVSTGVISLDEENRVTTINAAALSMLRLEQPPAPQTPLSEVVSAGDYALLERVLWRSRLRGRAAEQMELARAAAPDANGGGNGADGSRTNGAGGVETSAAGSVGEQGNGKGLEGDGAGSVIPVALTATALASRAGENRRGVVLVIEDLSELLAAQRAAAWSEVARRLAHEIKNPLTPIQLSAERIARNFRRAGVGDEGSTVASENGGADLTDKGDAVQASSARRGDGNGHNAEQERVARVVEECTATISREVAGMKAMVDEFTRFARLPHARLEPADLNEVVRQAVALYEDRLEGTRMDVRLARELPGALLDSEQLRRVFVNLIDNAIEALAETEGERRITIATGHDPARGLLIAEVADTGHGIARADFARLFQPYFSTRGRGTGLGLAIVQRIMAEHGGRIRAESNRPRGARMIVELPVAEESREAS